MGSLPLGLQHTLIRRQLARVDPAVPTLSLQRMFSRVYNRPVIYEYRHFRGTKPGDPDLTELTETFNYSFTYLNWRQLMRSYITKLKRLVRATRSLQRRVQRTVTEGFVNQQSTATEFYKRLAVGV